jgi:hypothetical protein
LIRSSTFLLMVRDTTNSSKTCAFLVESSFNSVASSWPTSLQTIHPFPRPEERKAVLFYALFDFQRIIARAASQPSLAWSGREQTQDPLSELMVTCV